MIESLMLLATFLLWSVICVALICILLVVLFFFAVAIVAIDQDYNQSRLINWVGKKAEQKKGDTV